MSQNKSLSLDDLKREMIRSRDELNSLNAKMKNLELTKQPILQKMLDHKVVLEKTAANAASAFNEANKHLDALQKQPEQPKKQEVPPKKQEAPQKPESPKKQTPKPEPPKKPEPELDQSKKPPQKGFDIGHIPHSPAAAETLNTIIACDKMENARGWRAPYSYCSKNLVLYYGDSCIIKLTPQNIIDTMDILEDYFVRVEKDFGVKRAAGLDKTRFTVYLSHSGLHPQPEDIPPGIVGLANEYKMMLVPSVFLDIKNDPAVVVHELCHALFHIPWPQTWLEESLNEFVVSWYMPSRTTIYNVTKGYISRQTYTNIFLEANKDAHKYEFGAFWAHICDTYGGPHNLGSIADEAFKTYNPLTKDAWDCLAEHLKVPSDEFIMRWVESFLELKFWKDKPETLAEIKKNFSNGTPFNPKSLVWNTKTCEPSDVLKRLQKGGFEVIEYPSQDQNLLQDNDSTRHLYIAHYKDGTATVSRDKNIFNTKEQEITKKFLVVIKIK